VTLIGGLAVAYWAVRRVYRSQAHQMLAAMGDPTVTVTADADGLAIRTALAATTLAWPAVKEVWQFKDVWLLFPFTARVNTSYALPAEAITPAFGEIVRREVVAHGGQVRS
jgi:hypothetical protein